MSLFSKKPTVKEQMKKNERVIRGGQRDMERERRDLERTEKKLMEDIKKAAKQGNKQAATILAKQLVACRKQKTRTFAASSKMGAIGNQQKLMHSNVKMAEAMGTATKTMQSMNKVMDPEKTAKMTREFEMQNAKMEMSEEMINDALDDILDDSDDEEEQDAIVTQVLDEIGIEIAGKMTDAPSAHKGSLGEASCSKGTTDADIEAQLAQLRT